MTGKKGDDSKEAPQQAAKDPLKEENEKLKEELKDLTDTLQRLQAEFDNYRKRCDRESAEFVSYANGELVKKLLSVLDNFELALSSPKAPKEGEFHKGMDLIYAQMFDTLEASGLKPISAKGEKFDPRLHEALLVEESDAEPNTVLEELQKGYLFGDKVLRHSKVKISKKKNEAKKDNEAQMKEE